MSAASPGILGQLERFAGLTPEQLAAATITDRNVLVTAGAGSGKTLTLVARYLHLLDQGAEPRQVAAITFTEKAALEMRSRLRRAVDEAAQVARDPEARARWTELSSAVESGRIGTIHSLCAEILRAHPAEAGIDPRFDLLDEAQAAALQAEAAAEALAWAADRGDVAPLFEAYTLRELERLLRDLLGRRLELRDALSSAGAGLDDTGLDAVARRLRAFLGQGAAASAELELRALDDEGRLLADAGDKLAAQVETLLRGWAEARAALATGAVVEAAALVWRLRREHMALNIGRRDSEAKAELRALREAYDAHVDPWLGGAKSSDLPPDPQLEARCLLDRPRLLALYRQAEARYRQALSDRRALDFDDLEGMALALLERPAVRARWQAALGAILVDEYQDTNRRQQRIVDALSGEAPGRRFVVGDARQSIYRFRGADVTGFRETETRLRDRGGAVIRLDRSFRTHGHLTRAFDAILAPVMGLEEDLDRPYSVPYASLVADRHAAREGMRAPFVELLIGAGETVEDSRSAAAAALAARLLELRAGGQITAWKDVALLFRASTGYPIYESALELAGIPYVTVAGRGFYGRPEIRDLLNLLAALAEPWDDLAMAGLLRSPAFGLSDVGLLRLRLDAEGRPRALRPALSDADALAGLSEVDRANALRARDFLAELSPDVDRLPVAELLDRAIRQSDYRAILASAGTGRLWRNLDKLVSDARSSGQVRVRAWLDYVAVLRDLGAREGEAPDEAEGAVQLMTVHRAKGLQFPVVVIADASHQGGGGPPPAFVRPGGILAAPGRLEGLPLALRLARASERDESEAESDRLLYVAATRAAEKLLVSGHLNMGRGGRRAGGWLAQILDAVEVDVSALTGEETLQDLALPGQAGRIGLQIRMASEAEAAPAVAEQSDIPDPSADGGREPLFVALPLGRAEPAGRELDDAPERSWRVTGLREPPAEAVGRVVHQLIARWCFPTDARFDALLQAAIAGERLLGEPAQQAERRARELLDRLRQDSLYSEVESAAERYHELPYVASAVAASGREDAGRIDLLYRDSAGWRLVDFKTDALEQETALPRPHRPAGSETRFETRFEHYAQQARRYGQAVSSLLGERPRVELCFLDLDGALRRRPVGARPGGESTD